MSSAFGCFPGSQTDVKQAAVQNLSLLSPPPTPLLYNILYIQYWHCMYVYIHDTALLPQPGDKLEEIRVALKGQSVAVKFLIQEV